MPATNQARKMRERVTAQAVNLQGTKLNFWKGVRQKKCSVLGSVAGAKSYSSKVLEVLTASCCLERNGKVPLSFTRMHKATYLK